ncbi:MAG TPA: hypothetical protein VK771_07015 [Acidimicrobiia bacterium]|nr:hypothetical protein [Acidimicrobiia bacterium]
MTPVGRVCGLLVLVGLLAGCKVDARVDITLRADGSGTMTARVALDADAVRRLTPNVPLERAVPLADVRRAGWTLSPWTPLRGGGDAITLTHGFVDQADLERRLADLVGETGVLNRPTITRTRGWFTETERLAVTVDLRRLATGLRSDAQLARQLAFAGLDVTTFDAQLRSQLAHALTLTVRVQAPDGQSQTVQLTSGKQATVSASSSRTETRRIDLLAAGAALILVGLLVAAVSRLVRALRRRRTAKSSPPDATEASGPRGRRRRRRLVGDATAATGATVTTPSPPDR